jgi:ABC-type glycerol-3-phosphate transport system permease component
MTSTNVEPLETAKEQTAQQVTAYPRLGRKRQQQIGTITAWLILAAGGVIMMLPFAWMVSASVKGLDEIYAFPPRFIPEKLLLSNYITAWQMLPFGRFFLNSTIVSVSVVLGQRSRLP